MVYVCAYEWFRVLTLALVRFSKCAAFSWLSASISTSSSCERCLMYASSSEWRFPNSSTCSTYTHIHYNPKERNNFTADTENRWRNLRNQSIYLCMYIYVCMNMSMDVCSCVNVWKRFAYFFLSPEIAVRHSFAYAHFSAVLFLLLLCKYVWEMSACMYCMYVCMLQMMKWILLALCTLASKALNNCFHVRDDAFQLVAFLLRQLGPFPIYGNRKHELELCCVCMNEWMNGVST